MLICARIKTDYKAHYSLRFFVYQVSIIAKISFLEKAFLAEESQAYMYIFSFIGITATSVQMRVVKELANYG